MKVELLEYPGDREWSEVRRRCLVTAGKDFDGKVPGIEWRHKLLEARHSPIRYLRFSFYIECPYWVSVHLCRHVHAQPYFRSQRNDRQHYYDRNAARQDALVSMIWDVNAEELMVIANKRLCSKASPETREVVELMRREVEQACPEFRGLLVPMCEYQGGVCHEINGCGR